MNFVKIPNERSILRSLFSDVCLNRRPFLAVDLFEEWLQIPGDTIKRRLPNRVQRDFVNQHVVCALHWEQKACPFVVDVLVEVFPLDETEIDKSFATASSARRLL